MTRILLDVRRDIIGGTGPAPATLTARRTSIRRDGAVITYPADLRFVLPTTIDLDPPAPGEAWVLQLYVAGEQQSIYRTVTFTGTTVAWADLTEVDSATLNPTAEPPAAAWTAALAGYLKKPTVLTSAAYDALTPAQKAAPVLYLLTD